jgi:hypothetical protein
MTKEIRISIKTPFGEVVVCGETPEDIFQILQSLNQEFYTRLNSEIPHFAQESSLSALEGIVGMTADGPLIVTKRNLTHYESIALILYCSKDYQCSMRKLRSLLLSSGKNVTVPARLNEMIKKGYIFKPNPKASEYRLSTNGVKWIEGEILTRLLAQKLPDSN